jgi:hypothetical protein
MALVNRVDDLESRLDYLGGELRALRGRVTGAERKRQAEQATAPAGDMIEEEPFQTISPNVRTRSPSSHLARRLRSF